MKKCKSGGKLNERHSKAGEEERGPILIFADKKEAVWSHITTAALSGGDYLAPQLGSRVNYKML